MFSWNFIWTMIVAVILTMMALFIIIPSIKLHILEGKYIFRMEEAKWERERDLILPYTSSGSLSARILLWVIH